MENKQEEIVLALDWTPNTNHTGFYVAKALGLYEREGLKVRFVGTNDKIYQGSYSPSDSDSNTKYVTPCSQVAEGKATFAINSPEGVVNWNTCPGRPCLKAVAAILQKQTSAVVSPSTGTVGRPRDLDGRTYASYAARFEGRIVQQMVINDGGEGKFQEMTPPMLGIFETIMKGKADATWVFMGWEGIEAQLKGVSLNAFYPQDYGIPYAYAPCLVAHPDTLQNKPEVIRRFLSASARGWQMAAKRPEESALTLVKLALEENGVKLNPAMTEQSAAYLADKCLDEETGEWGVMKEEVWDRYISWMCDSGLLTTAMQSRHPDAKMDKVSLDDLRAGRAGDRIPRERVPKVFTNEFLPKGGT
uniref:Thiamine pyrimidine synthase n=1 Tax=Tetraselmis sp. GSL018 TaxID=582737 RepID=A0A061R8B7_9CHLO|mmetsp:Transcript_42105/g.99821  ORF Transcript_42105/g.99821 Transcript_42105/m.99821 type:complete len:360 (+) Transcript_42105:106-1185(+)